MIDRRQFVVVLSALAAGCSLRGDRITIGGKNFTEQLLLGELLAQYLGARVAIPVERRLYLAGTYICHQALLAGRIDAYVEYTGTALTAILKRPPQSDHVQVYEQVKNEYRQRFKFEVLPPLGFDNSFAIIVRGEDAKALGLRTLSDLSRAAPQMRMGVGYEFLERADGFPGLARTYGLQFAQPPRVMDLGLMYRALKERQVDVIAGANTDGLIAALSLVVLEDDRHYFPPYDAVTVLRGATAERHPEVLSILQQLSGKITAEQMRRMNYAVDGQHRDASEVVREFLTRL